jgi:transglutaminase-like putative cysteine protease
MFDRCTCTLFEDSTPLPGRRALHEEIRNFGGGLWSHWSWTHLVFSSSDNSDPRSNGRVYRLVHRENVEIERARLQIRQQAATFSVSAPQDVRPVRVTIANLDSRQTVVVDVRRADTPDFSSVQGIVKSTVSPDSDGEAAAEALYRLVRDWRYHYYPPTVPNHLRDYDPISLLRIYGYGQCGEAASGLVSLLKAAGLPARTRGLGHHIVAEAFFDGGWHMLDPDGEALVRNARGDLASVDEIVDQPELIRRGLERDHPHRGIEPTFLEELYREASQASEPSPWSSGDTLPALGRSTEWKLRAKESVTFDFLHPLSHYCTQYCSEPFPPLVGNGALTRRFNHRLDTPLQIRIIWPYTILSAVARGTIDQIGVPLVADISFDGHDWESVPVMVGDGEFSIDLTTPIRHEHREIFSFSLRISASSGGEENSPGVEGELVTSFQFAPMTHPRVQPGLNEFTVNVAQDGPDPQTCRPKVKVALEWTRGGKEGHPEHGAANRLMTRDQRLK